MVLYKCGLCNKEFDKKYNYTMHINRKNIFRNKYLGFSLIKV